MAVPAFKKVELLSTPNEGLQRLKGGESVGVVFLSEDLGDKLVQQFVASAKTSKVGEDAAYVLVFRGTRDGESLAKALLWGVHACLCEPYSVDRLTEILELARRIRHENEGARKKAALQMLVGRIVSEFDKIAAYASQGLDVTRLQKRLRESCSEVAGSTPESVETYLSIACRMFEETQPPLMEHKKTPSKRIKERLEAKLREQYEKDLGVEGSATAK